MQRFLAGRTFGFALSIAIVAGIAFLYRHILLVNQTTVALTLLLAILAVSAVWGMVVSVFMSVVAMVVFNYEFLPPVGNLTIADPQNWVDRKSTRLNSSHVAISYAVFCLKKKTCYN